MQGTLKNPYNLLQSIAQKNITGRLSISIPQDDFLTWDLYIGGSRLYFATAIGCGCERFDLLWQQLNLDIPLPKFSNDKSEYESLYDWQLEHQISLTRFRQILLILSREALIQAISHNEASVKFEANACIKPVLIAAPIHDLIKPIAKHVRLWQQLHNQIPSPFSLIYLDRSKVKDFSNFWENAETSDSKGTENPISLQTFSVSIWLEILEKKLSIYEVCRQLKVETHILSLLLYPLIESQILELFPSSSKAIASQSPQGPLIACIDDSNTVQNQVKMVLEMSGFQVLGITEPSSCLTSLVRRKPALILMDITMPEINGYELCAMLRQSRHLRNVPIVMFTGRDGIIDRMRAQLVGANDYLTKPVTTHKLIEKVHRMLQKHSNHLNQEDLVV
ncbi:response regulator [Pseudanabaena sp. FACHB-1998]|uniref:response regulator n=1 Tax=Pseudanabaena sp. FACHB-1998 TaxID=2692858 RepID=UPI001680C893|nr:response regulator [Pseudanabaena sp. FACHB-1998]MBD2178940.1 response regulator [Pseudanabaena sp. FACHB-1998]